MTRAGGERVSLGWSKKKYEHQRFHRRRCRCQRIVTDEIFFGLEDNHRIVETLLSYFSFDLSSIIATNLQGVLCNIVARA